LMPPRPAGSQAPRPVHRRTRPWLEASRRSGGLPSGNRSPSPSSTSILFRAVLRSSEQSMAVVTWGKPRATVNALNPWRWSLRHSRRDSAFADPRQPIDTYHVRSVEATRSTLPWSGGGTPGGGKTEPRDDTDQLGHRPDLHLTHHVPALLLDGGLAGAQVGGD